MGSWRQTAISPQIVAYLGPRGSYSHQATAQHFPELPTHSTTTPSGANEEDEVQGRQQGSRPQQAYTLEPQRTIEAVFSAVQTGKATAGVVPFENSSNGPVAFTLDLLADRQGLYGDSVVCGEIYLPVRHCLVGHPGPSQQSSSASAIDEGRWDFSRVTKLYTHPQAWGQCRAFLSKHLSHAERQDVSSTSRAAELVALEGPESTSAAISSSLAATIHNLSVLAEPLEDAVGVNSTRFLIMRRLPQSRTREPRDSFPIVDRGAQNTDLMARQRMSNDDREISLPRSSEVDTGLAGSTGPAIKCKTLVAFAVGEEQHESPGALADALAVFREQGLNLTSINTRPSGEGPWHYVFFVECVGPRDGVDGNTPRGVEAALRELDKVVKWRKWLGSWEDAKQKR